MFVAISQFHKLHQFIHGITPEKIAKDSTIILLSPIRLVTNNVEHNWSVLKQHIIIRTRELLIPRIIKKSNPKLYHGGESSSKQDLRDTST